jgi:hypothetical protein
MGKTIKFVYVMILFVSLLLITAVDSGKALILSIIIFCWFYTQSFTNFSDISLLLVYQGGMCHEHSDCVGRIKCKVELGRRVHCLPNGRCICRKSDFSIIYVILFSLLIIYIHRHTHIELIKRSIRDNITHTTKSKHLQRRSILNIELIGFYPV